MHRAWSWQFWPQWPPEEKSDQVAAAPAVFVSHAAAICERLRLISVRFCGGAEVSKMLGPQWLQVDHLVGESDSRNVLFKKEAVA